MYIIVQGVQRNRNYWKRCLENADGSSTLCECKYCEKADNVFHLYVVVVAVAAAVVLV